MHKFDHDFVRAQIDRLRLTHPTVWDDDEQLLSDMLEGTTQLHEYLNALMKEVLDLEAFLLGIPDIIETLRSRKVRMEAKLESLRHLMQSLLEHADLKKIELPARTLSIKAGTPHVIVTDESLLPPDCIRVRREPDKVAIAKKIKGGEIVMGATMSNPEPTLQMSKR